MYRIVSPSGLAVDNRLNPDNLGNLFLSPVDKTAKGQLWRFVKYGDAYVVFSPFTNKSFDVVNAGSNPTPLGTWDFSRANVNQHFLVAASADGTVQIRHENSSRALSCEDQDGENPFQVPGDVIRLLKYVKAYGLGNAGIALEIRPLVLASFISSIHRKNATPNNTIFVFHE